MNTVGNRTKGTAPTSRYSRAATPRKYREPASIGTYQSPDEAGTSGGLRDSCADPDTYPWRIVGYGDGTWGVEGHNNREVHRGTDCEYAHAVARAFKVLHPEGHIDVLDRAGSPNLVSGPGHTIPQRLAGLLFEVTNLETDSTVRYLAGHLQSAPDRVKVQDLTRGQQREIPVSALVNSTRIKVRLDIDQFLATAPAASEAELA